jgi:uncharacterized protein
MLPTGGLMLIVKCSYLLFLISFLFISSLSAQQFSALLFTKTEGYHHTSINEGVDAMRKLSEKHFFSIDWQENSDVFNDEKLKKYDVIIFLSTSGDILNDEQKKAMERFIESGKGYVGIHSASDTEFNWPWYTKLVGRMFYIHPPKQTALLNVIDNNFPGMTRLPKSFFWTDEWYEFSGEETDDLKYLLTVDEKTYDTNAKSSTGRVAKSMGNFHPVSWYHEFDGGRSFYTALGHIAALYEDDLFLEHIYGGIYWAATGKGIIKK